METDNLPYSSLDDPPYHCGWHLDSKKGFRCGNPTTLILIGAESSPHMFYIPICPTCVPDAMNKGMLAHRYGEHPDDLPEGFHEAIT